MSSGIWVDFPKIASAIKLNQTVIIAQFTKYFEFVVTSYMATTPHHWVEQGVMGNLWSGPDISHVTFLLSYLRRYSV